MRAQSPESRKCNDRLATAAVILLRTAAVLSSIGIVAVVGTSQSTAQEIAKDVAYVEAVSGRVVSTARANPVLLDALDMIGDQTRLELQANSELRLCHHRTQQLLTLKGPLRASISAHGVTAANGSAVGALAGTCLPPVTSSFQGGLVLRGLALPTMNVPLQPRIKVVNRGAEPINRIVLWDAEQQTILSTFDRHSARPTFDDGQSYVLVVERRGGSELKMVLKGSAMTRTAPVIIVVP